MPSHDHVCALSLASVDLEPSCETDDEIVDLWCHDGSEWETIEEDLSTADDTVKASVDRNGLYVSGTEADGQDDDDDSDESNGSDYDDDSSENGTEDESSLADGPGFTIGFGLIALIAAAGMAVRRQ